MILTKGDERGGDGFVDDTVGRLGVVECGDGFFNGGDGGGEGCYDDCFASAAEGLLEDSCEFGITVDEEDDVNTVSNELKAIQVIRYIQ